MDAPHGKVDENELEIASEARAGHRDSRRNDPDRDTRWAAWREENAGAMISYNAWFKREGHRYLRHPQF